MKAYVCTEQIEGYSIVVFAETAGKARYKAMSCDELGDCLDFKDITVRRVPKLDSYYHGRSLFDWEDPEDRLIMVRECGYTCHPDCFEIDECEKCPAKEYCDRYEEYLAEYNREVEYAEHCQRHEPTYNPEDGSM